MKERVGSSADNAVFGRQNHLMRAVIMDSYLTGRLHRPLLNMQLDNQPVGASGGIAGIFIDLSEYDLSMRTAAGDVNLDDV